jgi:Fur family transcriptional regulator, peroxide stress response regulator
MHLNELRSRLTEKGLKITPQRIAVYDALVNLHDHPTAERIIEYVRQHHPNIATGTVYKVLDTLCTNEIISRVKTDKDVMRYDAVTERHHHLYSNDSDRIEDFSDPELDKLLLNYFRNKELSNFQISEIKLHIAGKFSDTGN